MAPELFGVQRRRHQDRPNYYTKEAASFTVGKVTSQLYDQGHDLILYTGEGYKFWTMTLDVLCKVIVGSRIDHVRWHEPVDCWRSTVNDNIKFD